MAQVFLFPSGLKPLMFKSGPMLSDPEDCPEFVAAEEVRKRYGPKFEAAMKTIFERGKAAIEAKPA
jgi:hypothetical protein